MLITISSQGWELAGEQQDWKWHFWVLQQCCRPQPACLSGTLLHTYKIWGWTTHLVPQYKGSSSPENGECAVTEWSHPHTTPREPFTPTTDKPRSCSQPGKTSKTLGHSRRVLGRHVYPRKPKPAAATNVIMETLLFSDGNQLQRTQLWLQQGKHLWPMLGPRCDGATSISNGSIPRPPMGKGVMGCSPSSPCMARAKGWEPRWEMGPQQRACGRGRRGLKSHFKGNQKQPLLMLWRFKTIIGGLNPFQGEISCQVWVIAQSKARVMWKWVINIERWRWETYNWVSDKTSIRTLYIYQENVFSQTRHGWFEAFYNVLRLK